MYFIRGLSWREKSKIVCHLDCSRRRHRSFILRILTSLSDWSRKYLSDCGLFWSQAHPVRSTPSSQCRVWQSTNLIITWNHHHMTFALSGGGLNDWFWMPAPMRSAMTSCKVKGQNKPGSTSERTLAHLAARGVTWYASLFGLSFETIISQTFSRTSEFCFATLRNQCVILQSLFAPSWIWSTQQVDLKF